jgi:hypothetical protein
VCFWAVRELEISSQTVAHKLGIAQSSVSRAAQKGEILAKENNLRLEEKGQIT